MVSRGELNWLWLFGSSGWWLAARSKASRVQSLERLTDIERASSPTRPGQAADAPTGATQTILVPRCPSLFLASPSASVGVARLRVPASRRALRIEEGRERSHSSINQERGWGPSLQDAGVPESHSFCSCPLHPSFRLWTRPDAPLVFSHLSITRIPCPIHSPVLPHRRVVPARTGSSSASQQAAHPPHPHSISRLTHSPSACSGGAGHAHMSFPGCTSFRAAPAPAPAPLCHSGGTCVSTTFLLLWLTRSSALPDWAGAESYARECRANVGTREHPKPNASDSTDSSSQERLPSAPVRSERRPEPAHGPVLLARWGKTRPREGQMTQNRQRDRAGVQIDAQTRGR